MRRVNWVWIAALAAAVGCATPAEMRKIDKRVRALESGTGKAGTGRDRVAELGAKVEELERTVDSLNGRLDEIDRQAKQALEEAKAARTEANQTPGGPPPDASGTATPEDQSAEVQSYRAAHAKWRAGDANACIDLFTKFLQTYPSSENAADAQYWLADCYYKQGNYKTAILRFDDIVRQYPQSDKAPDALYRQGE